MLVPAINHEQQPFKKEPEMSFEDMAAAAQNPRNLPAEFEFDTTLVRMVAKEGQAWFVAKGVCDILGIDNPSQAVRAPRQRRWCPKREIQRRIASEAPPVALKPGRVKPSARQVVLITIRPLRRFKSELWTRPCLDAWGTGAG